MNHYSENDQLKLFKSLFKGREDVFAIRWEKGNKSGYVPAYNFDPYAFRLYKMKGGVFKDYKDKTYLPISDQQLLKHLNGLQQIGIYPLLHDNTSWFMLLILIRPIGQTNAKPLSTYARNMQFQPT